MTQGCLELGAFCGTSPSHRHLCRPKFSRAHDLGVGTFFQYGAHASATSNAALTSALTSLIVPGFDILTGSSLGLSACRLVAILKKRSTFSKAPPSARLKEFRSGRLRWNSLVAAVLVEPAHFSKVERGLVAPPSEATIIRLATDLVEDPDMLLALAGKVGSDL